MINEKELNKLGIKSTILCSSMPKREMTCDQDWFDYAEESDKYIFNFYIEIKGLKDEFEEDYNNMEELGYITGSFFLPELEFDHISFLMLCDEIGGDVYSMASSITDNNGIIKDNVCDSNESIAYIDIIYIEPKYRNMGIGSYVISNINKIIKYLLGYNPTVLLLHPIPVEKDEFNVIHPIKDNQLEKKLKNLCIKHSFKTLGKTDLLIKKVINI